MLDFKRFCASEGQFQRYDLTQIVEFGEWEYATDARIMVRRPKTGDGIVHMWKHPCFERNFHAGNWTNPKTGRREGECAWCDGSGKELVECQCADEICARCKGAGEIPGDVACSRCEGGAAWVEVCCNGILVSGYYVRLINAEFPGAMQVPVSTPNCLAFVCGDVQGLLMGIRQEQAGDKPEPKRAKSKAVRK